MHLNKHQQKAFYCTKPEPLKTNKLTKSKLKKDMKVEEGSGRGSRETQEKAIQRNTYV